MEGSQAGAVALLKVKRWWKFIPSIPWGAFGVTQGRTLVLAWPPCRLLAMELMADIEASLPPIVIVIPALAVPQCRPRLPP